MKRKSAILIPLVLTGLLLVRFFGAQMGMFGGLIEHTYPGLISTGSWIRCLENDPASHGYGIYGFLEKRKTDAAIEHSLEHIHSEDAYLWLNATTYLGSRERKESIPFLIKSLRHTASRSADERVTLLQALSNQTIGENFNEWKEWYLLTSPDMIPDWQSSLGHSPKTETTAKSLEATATSTAHQL